LLLYQTRIGPEKCGRLISSIACNNASATQLSERACCCQEDHDDVGLPAHIIVGRRGECSFVHGVDNAGSTGACFAPKAHRSRFKVLKK
jgi:hypothetical protein